MTKQREIILCIPDLHFPYHHPDTFKFLGKIKEMFKITKVIQMGDIVDQHGLGKWSPEPDAKGNLDELELARQYIQQLGKMFPVMDVLMGNHDLRVAKKLKESQVPSVFLKDYKEVYQLPKGWTVRTKFEHNGIVFAHGDGFSGRLAAIKMAERIRKSCVIGHVHFDGGILYSSGLNDMIFGMNTGCLIDAEAFAFHYAKNFAKAPVLGVGLIIDGVPHFIPLNSIIK